MAVPDLVRLPFDTDDGFGSRARIGLIVRFHRGAHLPAVDRRWCADGGTQRGLQRGLRVMHQPPAPGLRQGSRISGRCAGPIEQHRPVLAPAPLSRCRRRNRRVGPALQSPAHGQLSYQPNVAFRHFQQCPRQESNLRTRFRRPMLYPLSYEGGVCAMTCANMASWGRISARDATSPPLRLPERVRRGNPAGVGRVGAAWDPVWGRLRAAPASSRYRKRLWRRCR